MDADELRMMSSYYHPAKEADMAAMTEPLCLERGNVLPAGHLRHNLATVNVGNRTSLY